jgi:hypothetical protein
LKAGQQEVYFASIQKNTGRNWGCDMGKYTPLRDFLIERDEPAVVMTFAQIEEVLGRPLPASKGSRAWWSNNPDNNVMTREWLAAGYVTEAVDLKGEKLIFRRREEYPIIFPGESEADVGLKPTGRDPLFGCMRGTLKTLPDVDYTQPADPEWGKVYDDD